jgi:cerevisin
MASPHVAGLLAYFLSLYPSKEFNPTISAAEIAVSRAHRCLASAYALTRASLPSWAIEFLPSPALVDAIAPIPKPRVLSPAQLKAAVLKLASKGLLEDLPALTPNILVFNNATG